MCGERKSGHIRRDEHHTTSSQGGRFDWVAEPSVNRFPNLIWVAADWWMMFLDLTVLVVAIHSES